MKRFYSNALGAAALAVALLGPAPDALAANITISGPATVNHSVCGNSIDLAQGDCSSVPADSGSDGNTVTIGGGVTMSATSTVSGRWDSRTLVGSEPSAFGNTVNFSGVATNSLFGGSAANSSTTPSATANNNNVNISGAGASVTGDSLAIYGGFSSCGGACTSTSSGNTVTITSGTVAVVTVVGGSTSAGYGGRTIASDNTVEISGSANIGPNTNIYGGWASTTSQNNTFKFGLASATVLTLRYFQNLNFSLPASVGDGDTVLTVTSDADVSGTNVSIAVAAGSGLAAGDRIVLIGNAGFVVGAMGAPASVTSPTAGYTFSVVDSELANHRLVVEVTGAPSAAAPALSGNFIDNITTTSATLNYTSSQTGVAYWMVYPATTACPANGAGLSVAPGNGSALVTAGVGRSNTWINLTPATDYRLCLTVKGNTSGLYSAVWDETFRTSAPPGAPTVSVGAQSGTLTAGTAGVTTFTITTTNVADGTPGTVDGLPIGATASAITVNGNTATLTVVTTTGLAAGTYPLTVTIDGVTSPSFDLVVVAAPPAATVSVSTQNGTLTEGTVGTVTFDIATTGIGDGNTVGVNDAPPGVSVATTITSGNASTLTVTTTAGLAAGTYEMTVTIDGVTSDKFDLVVGAAAPATPITEAFVDVDTPATGNAPTTVATPYAGSHFTASAITWMPADRPFVAGVQYTATVTLTAASGYTFTGLTHAVIAGHDATISDNTGGTVKITYQFQPAAIGISSVAVNVSAPAAGNAPSPTATPAGSHYTVGAVTWSPADNPFATGVEYTATVTITADAGYDFTGLVVSNITINGHVATVTASTPTTVTATYKFAALAPRGANPDIPESVPTLGQWALMLLALLLAGAGAVARRRYE